MKTITELKDAELDQVAAAGVWGTVYKIASKVAPVLDELTPEPTRRYESHYVNPFAS